MSERFKPLDRDQLFLLPPSLQEWLPAGDLAHFVIDVVEQLDLGPIYHHYEVSVDPETGSVRPKAAGGQPPFHPKMMAALVLYAYANGTPSSRRIAHLCERDVGYRMVAANQQPDFRTISEFRRIHLKALEGLFVEVLHLACEAGLVKLGHVALDGTKVKANASKHKAMSYARLVEREAEYAKLVEELLRQAEETDAAEDELYGPGRRGDELPEELRFRQKRLEKIREAKRALEEAAKEKARAEGKLDENDQPKDRSFIDRVRRKLWTQKGRATYAKRKGTAEPVFGQIKQGRGLRQFLLRGRDKIAGEWSLWCTGHNVLKLWAAASG